VSAPDARLLPVRHLVVHIHDVNGRCGAAPPLASPRLKRELAGYVANLSAQ
jgi:hypothetical protein